jgi:hypothetical protein
MNEHRTPEDDPNTFDGDAISRADREFLASLGDHPLVRNPLYSVPPPPRPNYDGCTTVAERAEAQKACFPAALVWMLVNYAYYTGAFIGKGGIISLVDGEICAIASLRSFMHPYTILEEGPRGGLKKTSVVDVWMMHPQRAQIDKIQTCPDRPRPTFIEDGLTVYNRYWPPAHPAEGGDIGPFEAFFARLVPDDAERTWFWNYLAHKARRPWVPMVAVIMVAEEFGSGRGTLFDILELLFGEAYVVPCSFGELTGAAAGARFNARLADALIAVVNEAVAEDGEQQAQRRLNYEALKNSIDPSPTARRRFEAKGQHAYSQRSAMSVIIATQHRDVVKLPWSDRRFSVVTCGKRMTKEDTTKIRAWMAVPENIGALYRALLNTPAVPKTEFDPFDEPPLFAGRREMIGMGKSRLEDSYEAAIDALDGFPLFTMAQAQRLISYFGDFKTGDWSDKARHTVAKNAYRLRERNEPNNRIEYRKRKEIIYARTKADQQRWRPADTALIIKQLHLAEAMIAQLINTGLTDIEARLKELRRGREDENEA